MTAEEKQTEKSEKKRFSIHPKLKIWLAIMGVVVVVAVGVMSLVMVCIPVDYGVNINIANVDYIGVRNTNVTTDKELFYRAQDDTANGAAEDSVRVTTIKKILDKINNAATGTNRFKQVFMGQGGNEYVTSSYSDNVSSSSSIQSSAVSGGIWIRVAFKNPQYRVRSEQPVSYFETWNGNLAEATLAVKNTLVTSIYFPLGLLEDGYRQQKWYLGLGFDSSVVDPRPNASINTKLVTYGDYSDLKELVTGLTAVNF